jgi:hypothetical protein
MNSLLEVAGLIVEQRGAGEKPRREFAGARPFSLPTARQM